MSEAIFDNFATTTAQSGKPNSDASSSPKVRKDFSETLSWQEIEIKTMEPIRRKRQTKRGLETISVKAPDSITSYIFSGVAMNNRYGLALPLSLPSMRVFLPFFIQINLPFSIKRGEILKQDIYIFNYLSQSQTATVTIESNDSEFIVLKPETDGWSSSTDGHSQTFDSLPNETKRLKISLKANILGFIKLKVKAFGDVAGDAVELKLRVVPEGVPKYYTNSTIIVKENQSVPYETELTCTLPQSAVNDTIKVSTSIVGDILGTTLNNLENLLQASYGCGEQNMLNFVPNIVILRYLEISNQLTDSIRTKTLTYIELGYQRELEYLRTDGSFSAFGNSDPQGSTWLTGFVVKSFLLAKPYTTIDMNIIQNSLNFILSKQNTDGSFREDGRVIHTDMQGGANSGISLTAYITVVLSECLTEFPYLQMSLNQALDYLIQNHNKNDVYSLGITSYALRLNNSPNFTDIYAAFENLSITESAGELHWAKLSDVDANSWWYSQPRSLDVEITAYGLLTLYSIDITKSLQIIRWLVKQQNSNGGFQSTQDTVVAIEALSNFAARFKSSSSNLHLTIQPNDGSQISAEVNSNNALVLQSFDLYSSVRKLSINADANSTGLAIITLACNFYEVIEEQYPRFTIEHRFEDPCIGYLTSAICLSYIPINDDVASNMVLMRMSLPSGYRYEERGLQPDGISVSCFSVISLNFFFKFFYLCRKLSQRMVKQKSMFILIV